MNSTVSNSSCVPLDLLQVQGNARIFEVTSISVLGLLGIVSNLFIILLAIKFTARKNLHYLIINMCTADTLGVLFTGTPSLLAYLNFDFYSVYDGVDVVLCKGLPFVAISLVLVSLNSLLVISIERFRATKRTLRSPSYSIARQVVALIFCWVISMAEAFHAILIFRIVETPASLLMRCNVFFGDSTAYWITLVQFVFILSTFFLIIGINVVTLRSISKTRDIHAHLSEAQRQIRSKRTKKVVAMILCSVFLCILCYLPFSMLSFIIASFNEVYLDCSISKVEKTISVITNFLPLLNYCLSPCIYIIFLSDFKEAAKRLVCAGRNNQITNRAENTAASRHVQTSTL